MHQPPKPRITRAGVAWACLFWGVYTVLYAILIGMSDDTEFWGLLLGQTLFNGVRALLALPVWWLMLRRLDTLGWVWKAPLHLLLALLYAAVSLAALYAMLHATDQRGALAAIDVVRHWIFWEGVTLYVIQFSVFHVIASMGRLRWRERQAAELVALAQERELAALKAQINPHFLFNTLNTINAMIGQDAEVAREMVADLADLMRYTLTSSSRDLVTLGEELAFVQGYLAVEAQRFGERLRVTVEVDDDLVATLIPPMVLQPLVENAVRHGIAPSEVGGTITIRAFEDGGYMNVSVADTGIGPQGDGAAGTTGHGIGLSNTDARLQKLFGAGAALHTEPLTPHGFHVTFRIPLSTSA